MATNPEKKPHPTNPEKNPHPTNPEKTPHPTNPEKNPLPTNPEKNPLPTNPEKTPHPTNPEKNPHPTNPEKTPHPTNPEKKAHPTNPDAIIEPERKVVNWAEASDRPRREREEVNTEAPLDVHIECSSLMKIATHCTEKCSDQPVNGFLVGSLRPTFLEITNAFPLPDNPATPDDFQNRMLKNFKDVGLDFIIVGFYQSIQFGDLDTSELFISLYEYMTSFHSAVAILFDIDQSQQGNMVLRAYRLKSEVFRQKFKEKFSARNLNEKGIRFAELFTELNILYKASPLSKTLLYELMQDCSEPSNSDFLNIFTPSHMDSTIQSLMKDIDMVSQELSFLTKEQRKNYNLDKERKNHVNKRKEENEERKKQSRRPLLPYTPEELDKLVERSVPANHFSRLVLSSQLHSHAKQAQLLAENGMNKMVVTELLNK